MNHFKVICAVLIAIAVLAMPFAANAESITYSGTFNAEDPTFSGSVTSFTGNWTAVVEDTDFLALTGVGFEVVNGTLTSLTMSPSPFGSTVFDTTNVGFQIGVFDGVAGNMAVGGIVNGVGGVAPSAGVDDWFANYFPGTSFSANGAPLDGRAAEASWTTAEVNQNGGDRPHGGTISTIYNVGPFALTAPCVDDPSLTCATGIEGLTISGFTYDVDFVLDSYNSAYSAGPPLFQGEPAFVASNAVAAALSSFDGIFGVVGKGSVRSQILVPSADFGDIASANFLVCTSLNTSGCSGWVNSFASLISKSTVTDGPDVYGSYARFRLSDPNGQNQPPVADAGSDQAVRAGDTVFLDGGSSVDDNTATESLEYAWSFVSLPAGSSATLAAFDTATPSFAVDVSGTYVVQLVVTDEGGLASLPDEVIISSDSNLPPTPDAGPDQLVIVGSRVELSGANSSDPENDPITYEWSWANHPDFPAPAPTASGLDTVSPSFIAESEGEYQLLLIVSDPLGPSAGFDLVSVLAVSAEDFAQLEIAMAFEAINALPPSAVTTEGNQSALGNFLTQAAVAIQEGDLIEAMSKLRKAIFRTDGCALRDRPDSNGVERDWITDCTEQELVYDALVAALDAIQSRFSTVIYDVAGQYDFVIPDGVSTVIVRAWGAGGGGWDGDLPAGWGFGSFAGGDGGYVEAELPVTPGQNLVVIVGQGGREASCVGATPGSGGGGLAGVMDSSFNPLVAAGGGGGASYRFAGCDAGSPCSNSTPYGAGGDGFGAGGQASNITPGASDGSSGTGAPTLAGGLVGLGNCGTSEGSGGFGGGGGGGGTRSGFGGGGGGGGFPGGPGGAARRSAGFGGSNLVSSIATVLVSNSQGASGGVGNGDGTATNGSSGRLEIDY